MMIPDELAELRRLYLGFTGARVVLTANNLGVFDLLTRPATASAVSKRLKTDPRATEILLDALTGLGLVRKGRDLKYSNTRLSRSYLVKGALLYQGDIIRHASSMWNNFSGLDEVVKSGLPARQGAMSAAAHEAFIMGMHNLTLLRAGDLVKAIGIKGVGSMLDLGGGPGTNAFAMAEKGVAATIFDRPETIAIARKVARRTGIKGVRYIAGDFQTDDIGSGYDFILISQILHAYSEEENKALLEKCRAALNMSGRVVIQEFPIDNTRTEPVHSALFSVNMLVGTLKGRCYSPQEMTEWLKSTGYTKIETRRLAETVLVMGTLRPRE